MDDNSRNQPVLTTDMNENAELIKSIFKDDESLVTRYFDNQIDAFIKCCAFYIDGMVNNKLFNEDVIKPLVEYRMKRKSDASFVDIVAKQIILSDRVDKTNDFSKIIQAIVYGDCVLIISGCDEVLILNTKGWKTRDGAEPEDEKVLRGPREGFTESIMPNLTMLRRRLRTQELKIKFRTFGARSQTKGCICYIEGIADKNILAELERRLDKFVVDGVLDVNYINEFISDGPYSPVKTIGSTERPDVVAAKLLEGRIALFLDGTPVVLTVPCLFIENFQSSDDYYLNYFFASVGRILRILAFFISISTPAVYVALVTFHQEMLPTQLLSTIAMARQDVPLPTALEALVMLLTFEILREAGMRMPNSVGQAISIVGALVIGQAAVSARLVSAPMIIVIGITGITGLMIPRVKGFEIMIRLILLMLSSVIGLYGYIFGMMGLLIYLMNIQSFGIPIMNDENCACFQDRKDLYIRAPWWYMIDRPKFFAVDKKRSKLNDNPE